MLLRDMKMLLRSLGDSPAPKTEACYVWVGNGWVYLTVLVQKTLRLEAERIGIHFLVMQNSPSVEVNGNTDTNL